MSDATPASDDREDWRHVADVNLPEQAFVLVEADGDRVTEVSASDRVDVFARPDGGAP